MQRRNELTNSLFCPVFLQLGRKERRKEREREKKKALTISASLNQPRNFVLHLTFYSWYYENIGVRGGKISYKDHLPLAVPLFAVGMLMHLDTKTVAIPRTRCCSLRAGVTWGKAESSPRRDGGVSHGKYGKMTFCPTGNVFSLLSPQQKNQNEEHSCHHC